LTCVTAAINCITCADIRTFPPTCDCPISYYSIPNVKECQRIHLKLKLYYNYNNSFYIFQSECSYKCTSCSGSATACSGC
jgi:hypothetical protein